MICGWNAGMSEATLIRVEIEVTIILFVANLNLPQLDILSRPILPVTVTDFTIQDNARTMLAPSSMPVICHNVEPGTPSIPVQSSQMKVIQERKSLLVITTPVKPKRLEAYLNGYSHNLKSFLVSGFTYGFHIKSVNPSYATCSANLKSASQLPHVIDEKIGKEVSIGRISGPFNVCPFEQCMISPLGLRAKKNPGEYRVIHDLSYPYDDTSVNSSIPREFATIQYSSIADAAKHILSFGQYCFLAKSDIKSAFRIYSCASRRQAFIRL